MSSERTGRPISSRFVSRVDGERVDRMWTALQRRSSAARRGRSYAVRAGGFAIAACVPLIGGYWLGTLSDPSAAPSPPAPAALELARGTPLPELAPGATYAFADGSTVVLTPDTSLRVLENDGRNLDFHLASGRAEFDIRPGGPRRWTVGLGDVQVVVVGTRFVVERSGDSRRVRVERGTVLVRGESVEGFSRTLHAGDEYSDASPRTEEARDVAPAPVDDSRPEARPQENWRRLHAAQSYDEAWAAVGESSGLRQRVARASVEELLALADVARESGHPADAVEPLERVVREFPDVPDAGLAAFTLGRIRAGPLRDPAGAARSFSRALELGLPPILLPDATARLATALEAAGDHAGARDAAARYLRDHGGGAHDQAMRRLVE